MLLGYLKLTATKIFSSDSVDFSISVAEKSGPSDPRCERHLPFVNRYLIKHVYVYIYDC